MLKRARLVTLALAATACLSCSGGSKAQPPPAAGPSAGTSSGGSEAASNDPQSSKEELLKKTLARLEEIQDDLAVLRSLSFEKSVPAERQTTEKFREYLEREIERELPQEESAKQSRAVHHIGLIKKKIDLAATLKDALASQVGAYYDPRRDKFFMVLLASNEKEMDTIAAHELTHALQDQHFDLLAYYGEEPKLDLSEDELQARRFVVEGEATLLMFAYLVNAMTGSNPLEAEGGGMLATQIKALAAASVDTQVKMAKLRAEGMVGMDEQTRASLEGLESIPRYILVPLMESYTKGALPVMTVYLEGGWEAVDALYSDPPESTEQVLHPTEKLVKKRDHPVAISLPSVEGWEEMYSEVMGELVWRVYFENWRGEGDGAGDRAAAAAAGWDGDRFLVHRKGDDVAAILATTWDDEGEAKEFAGAYEASLARRFDGIEIKKTAKLGRRTGRVSLASRPDGAGEVALVRRGADVFIVDGAPSAEVARDWLRLALAKTVKTAHESER